MEKKFTILRVIATLYKIVGVLIALLTILLVILEIVGSAAGSQVIRDTFGSQFDPGAGGVVLGFLGALMTFIAGGLTALGVFAIGEAIYVLINLEENTRFTAILMRDRFYPPQMPPAQAQTAPLQPMAPPPANPTYPPAV